MIPTISMFSSIVIDISPVMCKEQLYISTTSLVIIYPLIIDIVSFLLILCSSVVPCLDINYRYFLKNMTTSCIYDTTLFNTILM